MTNKKTVKMKLKDTGGQALISCGLKFKRTKQGKPIAVDVPIEYVDYLLDKYGEKLVYARSADAATSDSGKVPAPYIAETMEPSRRDRQLEASMAAAVDDEPELVATPTKPAAKKADPKKKPAAKKADPKKKPAAKKPAPKKKAVEPIADGADGETFVGGAPA